ncbi:MAG: MarR family transcriptional regulator [Flavobacteriales bacterium]|nr:MarR family transcriptional regulator [Flavobacteriales bacterium]
MREKNTNQKKELRTVDYHLRVVWSAVSKMYNDKAKVHGYTMVLGFTLLSIDPRKGTPSTHLGPKMGVGATSLSRILKKLEKDKFISKRQDEIDRRVVHICLTDLGKEFRDYCKEMVFRFNEGLSEKIPKEKMDVFFEVMNTINEYATNNAIKVEMSEK